MKLDVSNAHLPSPACGRGWQVDLEEVRLPGEGVNQKNRAPFLFHPHPQPLSRQRERGVALHFGFRRAAMGGHA